MYTEYPALLVTEYGQLNLEARNPVAGVSLKGFCKFTNRQRVKQLMGHIMHNII